MRLAILVPISLCLIALVVNIGGGEPDVPARGIADRMLFRGGVWAGGVAVVVLLLVVSDITLITWRFLTVLKSGRTVYPPQTIKAFAAELGPQLSELAAAPIAARVRDRQSSVASSNSLLDDWIDARLFAEQTASVGPLILFPFVIVGLMVVCRSRLFDNWDDGNLVLGIVGFYLLVSVVLAATLNLAAEKARRRSLERMEADALWLEGTIGGVDEENRKRREKLLTVFRMLIEQVRSLRKGAFAPFFEQPLVQAVLVPLSGAGGVKLLDYLLLGQTL